MGCLDTFLDVRNYMFGDIKRVLPGTLYQAFVVVFDRVSAPRCINVIRIYCGPVYRFAS